MNSGGKRWLLALGWALAQVASGCGSNTPTSAPASAGSSNSDSPGLFDECPPGKPCESGLSCITVDGFPSCQQLCQSDADCNFTLNGFTEEVQAVCGTLTKEVKACTAPCDKRFDRDFACVDGHPVQCSALDDTSCATCGCADKNLRCEPNVGCQPKRAVDAECTTDSDCASGNCDQYAHVCRVAVGSSCTASNCERCIASRNGTYCSRACGYNEQCNGGGCMFQECRPACAGPVDSRCLGECRLSFHTGGGVPDDYACLCDPMECKLLSGPPQVGQQCDEDSDCGADGVCLHNHPLALEQGACSRHCSAENPCSKGQSCVNVPCHDVAAPTCGALCLNDCAATEPRCVAGTCGPLANLEAKQVEVCDLRKVAGAFCNAHNDCQSTLCTDGKCAAAAGNPDGN